MEYYIFCSRKNSRDKGLFSLAKKMPVHVSNDVIAAISN